MVTAWLLARAFGHIADLRIVTAVDGAELRRATAPANKRGYAVVTFLESVKKVLGLILNLDRPGKLSRQYLRRL